ncbi:MAG TPA: dihydrofolate reductase [Caulobacteraceae bacterium]|nr:dihydrofolate reductase [Caulobacteraceae bacterium]
MVHLALVVARARNGVIGRDGELPWRIRSDMAWFKANTLGKPIIMGRKTWDSLPKKPLPGRTNIVLSRDASFEPERAIACENFSEAVQIAKEQAADDEVDEVCIIGGSALFELSMPKARRLYLTEVEAEVEGDVFFPPFDETEWTEVRRESHPAGEHDEHPFTFRVLERR